MPNYAHVTLVGHIGKEPELRVTPKGESVLNFSVAVNDRFRKDEPATWWNCALWGKRADALKPYLHKGDPVMVSGEPRLRKYDGGVSLDVRVADVVLVKPHDGGARRDEGPAREQYDPEEIPF